MDQEPRSGRCAMGAFLDWMFLAENRLSIPMRLAVICLLAIASAPIGDAVNLLAALDHMLR